VNVPSATVKVGQVVEASQKAKGFLPIREALEVTPEPPAYLERDKDAVRGRLIKPPERDEIPLPVPVEERLVVEFMS
jgi:small subunit ribosomal protein S4